MKKMPLLLLILVLSGCSSIKKQIELNKLKEVKYKVELKSPKIPIGDAEAQVTTAFMGLKKVALKVSYSPAEDALCLEYKRNTVTYYQFFPKASRVLFLEAVDKYSQDYSDKKLVSSKTSKKQYGSKEGYLIWKLAKVSQSYSDNIDFYFGYMFKEKSPFFTITQGEAYSENLFADKNERNARTSGEIQLYFTRTQSMELAVYFEQQFLQSLTAAPEPGKTDSNVTYEAY